MEKLRKIIEQYGRWAIYSDYVDRIEAHVLTDFSQCVENSKSLIEGISKQICLEKEVKLSGRESFNKIIKLAFDAIGYKTGEHINIISGSLSAIAQQLGILRSAIGSTSHGNTINRLSTRNDVFDSISKDFLIDTVELITCFLIRNFENENPRTSDQTKILLSENEDFNDFWDEMYGEFSMGDYTYPASEILFSVDNKAYEAERNAYMNKEEDEI